MNAIPLDLCQWLRDMGMEVPHPHVGWCEYTDGHFEVEWVTGEETSNDGVVPIPPLLSPDPEHPEYGALGFVETLGWKWGKVGRNWYADFEYASRELWREEGHIEADDPCALLRAIRDRMQAAEVSAEGAGT
jgi:hypothetical protein